MVDYQRLKINIACLNSTFEVVHLIYNAFLYAWCATQNFKTENGRHISKRFGVEKVIWSIFVFRYSKRG